MKREYKHNKGVKIYFLDDTTLAILFSDGITKKYDINIAISKIPQLEPLKDPILFRKGNVDDWGGVRWTDDLDLSIDEIYENGTIIPNEEKADILVLGFKIKMTRWARNLTQKELATLTGIDQADISKMEKGIFNSSMKSILKVANALNAKLTINIELK